MVVLENWNVFFFFNILEERELDQEFIDLNLL